MDSLLKSLIFHPRLSDMITRVVKTCPICTFSAPKRIKILIGSQRSNYYLPSQCLVIDSAYFPRSQHGYKNALIIVDTSTGYVIIYPSQNLLAATIKKHFKKDLDKFLAKYGIHLSSTKPYNKGSTAQAESVIRLVKQSLKHV